MSFIAPCVAPRADQHYRRHQRWSRTLKYQFFVGLPPGIGHMEGPSEQRRAVARNLQIVRCFPAFGSNAHSGEGSR
jgi:hypothetical protein